MPMQAGTLTSKIGWRGPHGGRAAWASVGTRWGGAWEVAGTARRARKIWPTPNHAHALAVFFIRWPAPFHGGPIGGLHEAGASAAPVWHAHGGPAWHASHSLDVDSTGCDKGHVWYGGGRGRRLRV